MKITRFNGVFAFLLFIYSPAFAQFSGSKIDSLEKSLILSTNNEDKVDILLLLSDEFLTSDPDHASDFAKDALTISNTINYSNGQILSLINLAEIYQIKTDLKNSMEHALRAKEMANAQGLRDEYAKSTLIIANSFTQLGDFKQGSNLCFEALEVYESINNRKGICDALNGIGIIYFEQKHYDKALEYFQNSLSIARELNDDRGISRGLNNTSNVYGLDKENIPKSIRALLKAIEINRKTGQMLWLGINYDNLSSYYFEIEQYDSTFFYIHKALDTYKELNNQLDLARAYNQLASYYFDLNDEEQFLHYLTLAYEIGVENDLLGVQYSSSDLFQKYYESINDFESAYAFKTIQFELKDSLDKENSLTRLVQLELLYELQKKEQERKIEAQRKDFFMVLIILGLVTGLIVIVLLLIRYRIKVRFANLQQLKLEDELDFKNKELTANVVSLMKKNEMLAEITDKLIQVENHAVKEETRSAIHRIALDIENSTQEKIWEEFEMRFKQVHSDFYDKLIQRFPDLTPNEQRLCAFLRLNLNTKEISSISGQRPRAIEMARFRLRKKLGISTQEVNLVTFISKV